MNKITILLLFIGAVSFRAKQNDHVKLDGVINKTEWAGAAEHALAHGAKLYLLRRDEILYVGIRGANPGWAHIYLHWKDSVKVLHASAALGEQLYTQQGKDNWKLQKKFNWEVRDAMYDETLVQKQVAYFATNGWAANNNNTGDKVTLEYKIDLKRLGKSDISFAALYTADAKALSYYPSALNDHTLLPDLVAGSAPDDLHFVPSTWFSIK